MKVRVIMDLEVPETMPAEKISSRIAEYMTQCERQWEGFTHCTVNELWKPLASELPKTSCLLLCTQTFQATHTNSVGGKAERNVRTFRSGEQYQCQSWRPEGCMVDDFFVFHKHAGNFSAALK